MYLSIGNDMAVRDRNVIGIFDLDNTSTSKKTREFLEKNPPAPIILLPSFNHQFNPAPPKGLVSEPFILR